MSASMDAIRKGAEAKTEPAWQHQVYDLLRRNRVTQFAYVPDAGHKILIERALADPDVHSVALTTEEEGVALLAGAAAGATIAMPNSRLWGSRRATLGAVAMPVASPMNSATNSSAALAACCATLMRCIAPGFTPKRDTSSISDAHVSGCQLLCSPVVNAQ